jgi:hypothetical protein
MYKGFIFLRTDNNEIEDFLDDIFKDIPILIKISKDSNVKDLLEGSIKAVLLDKNCKDYEKLFNRFSKKDIGIISIGKEGDINFPFSADELLSKIDNKKLYIPEIKRFDLSKKLSGINLIKKISSNRNSNKEIHEKILEDNRAKKKKTDYKKFLKRFKLDQKFTKFINYFKQRKLEKINSKAVITECTTSKNYNKNLEEKEDNRNLEELTKLAFDEINGKEIAKESKNANSSSENISVLILKI